MKSVSAVKSDYRFVVKVTIATISQVLLIRFATISQQFLQADGADWVFVVNLDFFCRRVFHHYHFYPEVLNVVCTFQGNFYSIYFTRLAKNI